MFHCDICLAFVGDDEECYCGGDGDNWHRRRPKDQGKDWLIARIAQKVKGYEPGPGWTVTRLCVHFSTNPKNYYRLKAAPLPPIPSGQPGRPLGGKRWLRDQKWRAVWTDGLCRKCHKVFYDYRPEECPACGDQISVWADM